MLTREQIITNIKALEKQGASQQEIQGYLDSLKGQDSQVSPTSDVSQPEPSILHGGIKLLAGAGKMATNVMNSAAQPLMSLAATPVQALAKATGQPDPYANGMPGLAGDSVPVSPLSLRNKSGDALKVGAGAASIATAPVTIPGAIGTGFGIGAAQGAGNALLEGKDTGGVAKDALKQGAISGATAGVISGIGKLVGKIGEKISTSVIRPTKADVQDGFSIDTVKKYNLGGSLNSTLEKTQSHINNLSTQLRTKLKGANAQVNLDDVYQQTLKELTDESKLKGFGANAKIKNVLDSLNNEIKMQAADDIAQAIDRHAVSAQQVMSEMPNAPISEVMNRLKTNIVDGLAATGVDTAKVASLDPSKFSSIQDFADTAKQLIPVKISVPDAQIIKQAAGNFGSWQYGRPDPDSKATEIVYNTFYNKLKTAIEQNSPAGVKEINQELSKLIPVANAVIRRMPVAERNNLISLSDMVGLVGSSMNPSALGPTILNLISKSGNVGSAAMKAGPAIERGAIPIASQVGGAINDLTGGQAQDTSQAPAQSVQPLPNANIHANDNGSITLNGPVSGQPMTIDPMMGLNIEARGGKIAAEAADALKDYLIRELGKSSGKFNPAIEQEAQNFVDFLKSMKNPTLAEMNKGLEILRLQGKDPSPIVNHIIETTQKAADLVRDSLGRFKAK